MRTTTALALALIVTVLVSVAAVWLVPSLQDFMAGNTVWNGMRDFILDSNARSISTLDQLPESPERTTLVTIPYLGYTNEDLARLRAFVEQGGNLVLADDYGFGNQILDYMGVDARFAGAALLDPLFSHRNQWLPKAVGFAPLITESVPDIEVVLMNHATALTGVTPQQTLAYSSETSFIDLDSNELLSLEETVGQQPVAALIPHGAGNLVLVSDPSLFINSMINREDNRAFVQALVVIGGGERQVVVDASHLTASPLDISKAGLATLREILATPYALLGLVMAALTAFTVMMLRTGGPVEQQSKNS